MSSPSQEELDQQFKTLQTEIRQRFPITGRSPSRRGVLLLDVGNHILTKAAKVWGFKAGLAPTVIIAWDSL